MNDTRVIPARLLMRRATGGKVEGLFLRESDSGMWELMVTGSGRLKAGELLEITGSDRRLRLLERSGAGAWTATPDPAGTAFEILEEVGRPPLPPYIERNHGSAEVDSAAERHDRDVERYQTIYAARPGAVAAPTAGLHFTDEVFRDLDAAGIERVFVTLHVGVGTFAPIRTEELASHDMHAEWFDCSEATAKRINAARRATRPIVAVGTTSVRVLESCADDAGKVHPRQDWTNIFIYPPYRYRAVDCLITNFHLPGSTLLALVFAFASREQILQAYQHAIASRYRFFSYGDAMLIR
jgi:S-adenosylmethionine:tRNA ribosyltransferase-isomerase